MASWGQVNWRVLTRLFCSRTLKNTTGPVSSPVMSTCKVPASNENSTVDLAVIHDGKAVVCFHPVTDIPFHLTKAVLRPELISDPVDTHDLVLKSKLISEDSWNKQNPTVEELSKMFHTTKHRWYPIGEYHTRRKKRCLNRDH